MVLKLAGGAVGVFFEDADKVLIIFKTDLGCDVVYFARTCLKLLHGLLNAVAIQKIVERIGGFRFELLIQVGGADAYSGDEITDADLLGIMLLDIGDHLRDVFGGLIRVLQDAGADRLVNLVRLLLKKLIFPLKLDLIFGAIKRGEELVLLKRLQQIFADSSSSTSRTLNMHITLLVRQSDCYTCSFS